jgi:membrane protein
MLRIFLGAHLAEKFSQLGVYAAALSFYFFLSLIPFLVVSATLVGYLVPLDLTPQFTEMLKGAFPQVSDFNAENLIAAVKQSASSGVQTIGFIIAVWTSTSFMNLLLGALHHIFETPEHPPPRGILAQIKSLTLLFIWMNTLVLTAFCFILTIILEEDIFQLFFSVSFSHSTGHVMRDIAVFVVLMISFCLTYLVACDQNATFRLIVQGATLASIGWIGLSYLFAFLLPLVWKSSPLYGALGSVVATLIWAYWCSWVVLIGACWTARFSHNWE